MSKNDIYRMSKKSFIDMKLTEMEIEALKMQNIFGAPDYGDFNAAEKESVRLFSEKLPYELSEEFGKIINFRDEKILDALQKAYAEGYKKGVKFILEVMDGK